MPRRFLATGAAVALLALTGCGGADPPPPGAPSAAENLVSIATVHSQAKGSPEEALLRWWMHVQYNDLHGYLNDLAAPLRTRREAESATRWDLLLVSGESIRSQPKVIARQNENGAVTLFTQLETRQPVGATRFTTSDTPQAFTLIRESGQWRIADDSYILDSAASIKEARAKQREEQKAARRG